MTRTWVFVKLADMLGIFDSGIGGLTVLRALLERRPLLPFYYLGDTARTPYGDKSSEVIRRYAEEDVEFLLKKGATEILIACNTVSAHALQHLQERFPGIVFWNVIDPVIEAVLSNAVRSIGVIGTRATIQSNIYGERLKQGKPSLNVRSIACPLFVPLIEEGWGSRPEGKRIVKRTLTSLRERRVDALILGCTHYPLLKETIAHSISKQTKIIDGPAVVAEAYLRANEGAKGERGGQRLFFTDLSSRTRQLTRAWLGKEGSIESVHLTC